MIRKTAFLITGTLTGLVAVLSYNPPKLNENIATSQKQPTNTTDVTNGTKQGTTNKKSTTPTKTPTAPKAPSGDFVGDTVQTRWGPVQVKIVITDGAITDVSTLQFPDGDRRSLSISNQVIPWLQDEVLTVQSAQISGISGATYTSNGFKKSLASALQKAGI